MNFFVVTLLIIKILSLCWTQTLSANANLTHCANLTDCQNLKTKFGGVFLEFDVNAGFVSNDWSGPFPKCVIKCPLTDAGCFSLTNSIGVFYTYYPYLNSSASTLETISYINISYNGSHFLHIYNDTSEGKYLKKTPVNLSLKYIQCRFTISLSYMNPSNNLYTFQTDDSTANPAAFFENQNTSLDSIDIYSHYINAKPISYLYTTNSSQLRFRTYIRCFYAYCLENSEVKIFGISQNYKYYFMTQKMANNDSETIYFDSELTPFTGEGNSQLIVSTFYLRHPYLNYSIYTQVSSVLNLSSKAVPIDLLKYYPYLPYLQGLSSIITPIILSDGSVALKATLNFNGTMLPELNNLNNLGILFNVYWYADGVSNFFSFTSSLYTSNINITNVNGIDMIFFDFSTSVPLEIFGNHLNKKIYCKIFPVLNGFESPTSFGYQGFYVGIIVDYIPANSLKSIILFDGLNNDEKKLSSNKISLTEGVTDETIVRAYLTIPLVCAKGKSDCNLEFQITTFDTSGSEDLIRITACLNNVCKLNSCRSYMKNTNKAFDSNSNASWAIIPTVDLENILRNRYTQFQITVSTNNNAFGQFLNSISSPKITIEITPKLRPLTTNGYCSNDPHCKTFDNKYFEFQYKDGEFVIYENTKSQLWIHLISESCLKLHGFYWNYCIKGIYMQSIDDYISFEIKRAPSLHYIDLSSKNKNVLPLVWRDEVYTLPKEGAIQVKQDGSNYYITSHFGVTLVISKWEYMFSIIPSKLDSGNVNGLFGNYNNDPNDDFSVGRNGVAVNSDDAFFNTFNVSEDKLLSRFKFYTFKTASDETSSNSNDNSLGSKNYCKCNQARPVCSQAISKEKEKSLDSKKRLSSGTAQVSLSESFDLAQFDQNITQTDHDSCESTLRNNPSLVYCNNQGIINLNQIIQDCINDFNGTHIDIWPAKYLSSQQAKCKFVITNDQGKQQTSVNANGETVYALPTQMATMCLNSCSSHGTCNTNGVCECNAGYDGIDCSTNLNSPPNITFNTFQSRNNMCDTRTQNCYDLFFRGTGFSNGASSNVAVSISIYDPVKSTLKQSKNLGTTNVFVVNSEIVFLKLDNPNATSTRISNSETRLDSSSSSSNYTMRANIRYTNDISGSVFSNDITVLVYDSLCNDCTSLNSCTVKPSTCYINNRCYSEGDKNGNNLICSSKSNQYDWTKLNLSGASREYYSIYLITFNLLIIFKLFNF